MTVAGLVCVLTGEAWAQGSNWPGAVPGLALMGAAGALTVTFATRRRLLPQLRHRTVIFVSIGLISLPLACAVPNERQNGIGMYFCFAGAFLTLGIGVIVMRRRT
ncbi:hypothetical protein L1857_10050 [Amycolatopsis thermalba]|uniref:Uncharacterized protein n=1 Tax=Amycolatopsis thermalba TaxID=944492 RepID=A0ABY4NSZ4_9PSEU|nr:MULTISPECIES: hypothetical protein [Amycolatopsis]UQS23133.1 hypothetical protein L1857_10050 [Amycolatopsis thermalba]